MNAEEKVIEYEVQIKDMLHAIQERLEEFEGKRLDTFEQGRHLAYTEMMDIIQTRHKMILALTSED